MYGETKDQFSAKAEQIKNYS